MLTNKLSSKLINKYIFNQCISAINVLMTFKRHREIKDRHDIHGIHTIRPLPYRIMSIVYYVTVVLYITLQRYFSIHH